MNIFTALRKPYFATFLATLVLFVSCNQDNVIMEADTQTKVLTLDEYVTKHIELSTQLSLLVNSVDEAEIEKLMPFKAAMIETADLNRFVKEKGINISDQIIDLQSKMVNNTLTLYKNPQYSSLNEEELLSLTTQEIQTKMNARSDLSLKAGPCDDAFNAANGECLEDFAAAAATVVVVGLFTTFGVGTLIGGGIALIRFGECNKSAQADLADCRAQ